MTDTSEIEKEYFSSLSDLTVNSKPLINMLTILAEENIEHGQVIVDTIKKHITKISPDKKLPVLYLIDSIVKNVGNQYLTLFSHSIVNIFCDAFQAVDETVRQKMYLLRQTWNEVFPQAKLYALDVKTNALDPGWPINAKVTPTIHVNPNFFKSKTPESDILRDKQREILELQKRKLELELAATMKHIAEQEQQLQVKTAKVAMVSTTVIQPENCDNTQPTQPAQPSNNNFANSQYQSIDMIQPKTDSSEVRSRVEPIKIETVLQQAPRLRDPRLARQMQFQNPTQRNFPQRNRTAPHGPGMQRFGPTSASFASNNQLDNQVVNRTTAAFNATNLDDSGRQPPRTPSKNRSSSKDVKTRLITKTSLKSHKSNSQKSPKSPSTASTSKSSSKNSKTSPTSIRSSSKDHKKDHFKEKESSKLSPNRALAEAEKKIKEFTIPFKKRSPSPKDKSTKSITDPKVSSTTKTADSPIKFKGSKTKESKSRNYVRRNRDESSVPNKDIVEQKTPPLTAPTATTTTTAAEVSGSPIPPSQSSTFRHGQQ